MFDFSKLTPAARRAAFAHMGAASKVAKAKKKSGHAKGLDLSKTAPNVVKTSSGYERQGSISREDAAAVMFGQKGAQQRIAKAKKARARKSK